LTICHLPSLQPTALARFRAPYIDDPSHGKDLYDDPFPLMMLLGMVLFQFALLPH
jgi:hypothetical protein